MLEHIKAAPWFYWTFVFEFPKTNKILYFDFNNYNNEKLSEWEVMFKKIRNCKYKHIVVE